MAFESGSYSVQYPVKEEYKVYGRLVKIKFQNIPHVKAWSKVQEKVNTYNNKFYFLASVKFSIKNNYLRQQKKRHVVTMVQLLQFK